MQVFSNIVIALVYVSLFMLFRKSCDEPNMRIKKLGNETHNNECECEDGYKMSVNGLNCNRIRVPVTPPPTTGK